MGDPLASEYPRRLARLQKDLARRRLDAMVVFGRVNTFYLTGLRCSLSYLFVTPRAAILAVDGRYHEQACRLAAHCDVRLMKRVEKTFEAADRELHPRRVGFEGETSWADVRQWQEFWPGCQWEECSELIAHRRLIKSGAEIRAIEHSARLTDQIFEIALQNAVPGATEWDLRGLIRAQADRLGADELSFESIVATGAATSMPHYHPRQSPLRRGDLLLIDMGVIVAGYCSDMTRTVGLGAPPKPRLRRAYEALLAAQEAALAEVAPGVECAHLDSIARGKLKRHGLDRYFTHGLGHGVGLEIHEPPRLSAQSNQTLRPGMVVTIEPGVYFPGVGGIRIEDLAVVTRDGHRVLSRTPKAFRLLPFES